jgi:hypothetical protein
MAIVEDGPDCSKLSKCLTAAAVTELSCWFSNSHSLFCLIRGVDFEMVSSGWASFTYFHLLHVVASATRTLSMPEPREGEGHRTFNLNSASE